MTRSFRKNKRKSLASFYEYDFPNSNEIKYHSVYLKMVGATVFLTFILILVFIHFQKPSVITGKHPVAGDLTEDDFDNVHHSAKNYDTTVNLPVRFSQRLATTSNSRTTDFRSKRDSLRHHLKDIQILFFNLKYSPY